MQLFLEKLPILVFVGAGGYTITLQNDIYTISYCHVSPLFTVSVGDFVSQGEHIGSVGPKNVYGVINNPYRDSNGNPTNGATTGPHLHFTLKINNQAVNPLDYLSFWTLRNVSNNVIKLIKIFLFWVQSYIPIF